jgi:AcrR family transcriptional regulator
MRRLLGVLRAGEEGGDLAGLVRRLARAGLPVELEVGGRARELPAEVQLCVHRVAQEALTNVLKHADTPHRVEVVMRYLEAEVELTVRDDGRGVAAGDGQGHGLAGMRERVALHSGTLHAGPRAGGGYEVRARVPAPADDANSMPAATKTPDERRRNEKARTAILRAARELLDRCGFQRLTIEGIAERAGAGKATIYRWWPSEAAVVMDAVLEAASPRIPFPDTGSAREDLRRQIASVIELYTRTKTGRGIRALIAESRHDPSLAESLRDRFIASRRAEAGTVFERGELRPDLDVGVAIDSLYGAVYSGLLVSHARLDAAYADTLIDELFPAFERPPE